MTASSGAFLEQEIRHLVATVLHLVPAPAGEIRRGDVAQWDSLKHVEIVFALEDQYGIQFEESEFARLSSISAIAGLVAERLAA